MPKLSRAGFARLRDRFFRAKWLVVEQDEPTKGKTPMECAKMSIEYLNTLSF